MKRAKLGLILAATAFALWIAYLFYLTLPRWIGTPAIVLSRPQFLVAGLDVIAQVDQKDDVRVTVREVPWPPMEPAQKLAGQTIAVLNLPQVEGWTGPGLYILPLVRVGQDELGQDEFKVPQTPRSPGFAPEPTDKEGRPHIYPLNAETRWQLEQIRK
jgi:hypothetical protein